MWKQPYSVRLCTHILQDEAQRFNTEQEANRRRSLLVPVCVVLQSCGSYFKFEPHNKTVLSIVWCRFYLFFSPKTAWVTVCFITENKSLVAYNEKQIHLNKIIYISWLRLSVCGREKYEKRKCKSVKFFSYDLSSYYLLLPAVKCAAVIAPCETRWWTDGGSCWVLMSPPQVFAVTSLFRLCKQETTKEGWMEDACGNEQRKEEEGEEEKVSCSQWEKTRETEKYKESCHHTAWLIPAVLDIALSWEACS